MNQTANNEEKSDIIIIPPPTHCHECRRNRQCQEVVRPVNGVDKTVNVCRACLNHANASSRKAPRVTKTQRIAQRYAAANGGQ